MFCPFVMSCKKRVFAVQRNGSDGALDHVVVHLDGTIVKEALQAIHVFGDVGQLFAQPGLSGDAGAHGSEPALERVDQWFGLILPYSQAFCGAPLAGERLRPSDYEPEEPIDFKSGMSTGQSRSIRTLPREPITGAPTRTQ